MARNKKHGTHAHHAFPDRNYAERNHTGAYVRGKQVLWTHDTVQKTELTKREAKEKSKFLSSKKEKSNVPFFPKIKRCAIFYFSMFA